MRFLRLWSVLCWAASALTGAEAAALSSKGHERSASAAGGEADQSGETEVDRRFIEVADRNGGADSTTDDSGVEDRDDEDNEDDDEDHAAKEDDGVDGAQQPSNPNPQLLLLSEDNSTASEKTTPEALKRVVVLLQTLAAEIRVETEKETQLLDAHLCWCREESHSLKTSIGTAQGRIPLLQNDLMETASSLSTLEESKKKYAAEVEDGTSAVRAAESLRETERARAEQLMDDLAANIAAIGNATEALEAGQPADAQAFLQTRAADRLRRLARDPDFQAKMDDLDEGSRSGEAFLAYLGGSRTKGLGEVIGICKQLQESMEQDLSATQEKEREAAAAFERLRNTKESGMAATRQLIEQCNERLSSLTTKKGRLQDDLDATKESLAEDQMFLKQLTQSCQVVVAEYHKRQMYRQEELVSEKEAIEILNRDLDASSSSAPSFLQASAKLSLSATQTANAMHLRSRKHRGGHRRHRSHRTSAASAAGRSAAGQQLILGLRGSKGGVKEPAINFKLIRNLIDKTLNILDTAQRKDDKDFAYCNKEIADAGGEQSDLRQEIDDLEAAESEKNGTLTGLLQQISDLSASIKEQDELAASLTAQRRREHAAHVEVLVANNKAAELLGLARLRLAKMYRAAPPTALLQGDSLRAPTLSAPRAKLKTSKEALGDEVPEGSDRGKRVLDLIEAVKTGIQQESAAASENEANAQAEYERMVESANQIRSTDSKHLVEREVSRADTEVRLHAVQRDLVNCAERMSLLESFLKGLHAKCDQILANYDPHKAARSSEAEALQNAHSTLKVAMAPPA